MNCEEKYNFFIRFLKEHKAYIPYKNNTKYVKNIKQDIILTFKQDKDITLIDKYFNWARVKEPTVFWYDLHYNWITHISKFNNN